MIPVYINVAYLTIFLGMVSKAIGRLHDGDMHSFRLWGYMIINRTAECTILTQCCLVAPYVDIDLDEHTVYPKKYAHGFCFAVLCCGYTLTDFPISIRLTSLALWQSNDCPSASKATLMNMDEYFMWIHYERLYNHNKAKHNKTVCIFPGIYCRPPSHHVSQYYSIHLRAILQEATMNLILTECLEIATLKLLPHSSEAMS